MKEIKLYQCSICGTQYAERRTCIECEGSHKTKLKICKMKFVAFKNNKQGWPIRISVQNANGDIAEYRLS